MMGNVSNVIGLKELGESLKELERDVALKVASQAVSAAARFVRDEARKTTAFKDQSGALRKGIVMKKIKDPKYTASYIVGISTREMKKYVEKSRAARVELQGPTAPTVVDGKVYKGKRLYGVKDSYESFGNLYYFRFLEFGTVKMTPRPFLGPALENNVTKATEIMKKRLAARIERYKK